MKITYPKYYKNFKCTGSQCSDNCCIGWEINIDNDTNDFYKSIKNDFSNRLKSSIEQIPNPHFILNNERCPFLNENNLCDIIINLGEEHLCDICTNHPRFFEWFDDFTEKGIGLSCEEGARLLLENTTSIEFETFDSLTNKSYDTFSHFIYHEDIDGDFDSNKASYLLKSRHIVMSILQNRSISLWERIALILNFAYDLQDFIDNNYSDIKNILSSYESEQYILDSLAEFEAYKNNKADSIKLTQNILSRFQELEQFDPEYNHYLCSVSESYAELSLISDEFFKDYPNAIFEYENLMVYFIYRYFMKSYSHLDVLSQIKLAILSCIVIYASDLFEWKKSAKNFNLSTQIDIAKAYSKEIEYCEENIESLAYDSCYNSVFGYNELLIILMNL